jgi:hypothetical protein
MDHGKDQRAGGDGDALPLRNARNAGLITHRDIPPRYLWITPWECTESALNPMKSWGLCATHRKI